jgi:hypothetical protein
VTRIGPVELVVTHLTRMHDDHVCLAGLDRTTGRHIRPVTGARIARSYLDRPGGTVQIGSILRFTAMTPMPSPPEVEDHLFREVDSDVIGQVTDRELWTMLEAAESSDLTTIFGPSFHRSGHTWALDERTGLASLGVIRAHERHGPQIDAYGKVRMALLGDDGELLSIPVTDLRLFRADDGTPDRSGVVELKRQVDRAHVLLSVGVGRAWAPDGEKRRHWLQVNNIHVEPGSLR